MQANVCAVGTVCETRVAAGRRRLANEVVCNRYSAVLFKYISTNKSWHPSRVWLHVRPFGLAFHVWGAGMALREMGKMRTLAR